MVHLSIALAITLSGGAAALAAVSWAHGGRHAGSERRPTAKELSAYRAARPAFFKHCARCHTTNGRKAKPKSLEHFRMDGYPFQGHHAHEIGKAVRQSLLGKERKGPTMPKDDPGTVKDEDLKKILNWAEALDPL